MPEPLGQTAVPARCAHRPTFGGLVVPYVSVQPAGGTPPSLGAVHASRNRRCIQDGLCQICAGRLVPTRYVVAVPDREYQQQISSEAALHPECFAYSRQVCPVLNGRQAVYRDVDRHIGKACGEPGCDCDGWVHTYPDVESHRGRPVPAWWAVWLTAPYQHVVNTGGVLWALGWQGMTPARARAIRGPGG